MANYAFQCDDPDAAIEQVGSLLATLSDSKEAVADFNKQLSEHVGKLGEANSELVNGMISIGGKAFQDNLDNMMVVLTDSLLYPAFDMYVAKYGVRHEKDNRADI